MTDESRRDWFVGLTLALAVAWAVASSFARAGWLTATGLVTLVLALDLVFVAWRRDGLLGRLLVLCLVAGFVELAADHWLIRSSGTLDYTPGGPFVASSPLYMPFGWAGALFQLSYLGVRLAERRPVWLACVIVGLVGAVNIPIYEHCARAAGWWAYKNTPMLGNAPHYIILGELLAVLLLPLFARAAVRRPLGWSVALGLGYGVWLCATLIGAAKLVG
jgi:hypothetical protein